MIIVLLLLLALPDMYVWHHLLRNCHWAVQVVWWIPVIATIALFMLMQTGLAQSWMFRVGIAMMLFFVVPKLLFTIFSLVGQLLRHVAPQAQTIMDWSGGVVCLLITGILCYGYMVGWKRLVVNEVELTFDDLPDGFDGYRIAQLSDFHIGTYLDAPECVDVIAEKVNSLNADMVCFTGDLVNTSPSELEPFVKALSSIKAKDGVFSIMGNHDYCMYTRDKNPRAQKANIAKLQTMEKQFGWDLLLNENRMIYHNGDSLLLAGVENSSKPPFPDYGNLPKAMKQPEGSEAKFSILLSHDPTHWQREVLKKSRVQLQLSGHTHSTQFKLFGWTPASFTYKEYAGLYEMLPTGEELFNPEQSTPSARKLFVCTGNGSNVSFRFGVWPEIVLITLRKSHSGQQR